MTKIKQRIEKLLRLSMSNSPHEAHSAALKVVELMEKYSLSRADLSTHKIIIKEIPLDYVRIPRWVRSLYSDLAQINGCYAVWYHGFYSQAKMTLTGLESDVQNIEYYVEVLKNEIMRKAELFKKEISSEREKVKHYRTGLAEGIFTVLYKASQSFNTTVHANALVSVDDKANNAKEYFIAQKGGVRESSDKDIASIYYLLGQKDAKNMSVSRPIYSEDLQLKIELQN